MISAATPKAILIVDDEPSIRDSLQMFLEDCGHQVKTAASMAEALKLLGREPFGLAIVDVRLSDGNGNQLALEARALQPQLRILMHTGSIEYQLPPELVELGLGEDQVLRKPQPDLMTVLRRIETELGCLE
ncbi:two-component system response regulator [Geothermobacter hydrogeniphilus]|uniref:Two-component system response regulator n=1 Tax=Geothermobacter hydrogeniphilus TaxID=1969733 RepID=A0A2K2H7W6_9BACT|nr:response regulator [Geothermobacter hydrogeniphilus]PNU19402.1 two-component system response regulator [Geothermobacter hydrogeniphilus]